MGRRMLLSSYVTRRIFSYLVVLASLVASMSFVPQLQTVSAGTVVSGRIDTDTVWNSSGSPYWVVGDVFVEDGSTLTVENGTIVKFDGYQTIYVNGSLEVSGTPSNRVVFTSNKTIQAPGDWRKIHISSTGKAAINHAEISFSEFALFILDSDNNTVSNSTLSMNTYGIWMDSSHGNSITRNSIQQSVWKGIYFQASNNNSIIGNEIAENDWVGIDLFNSFGNRVYHNSLIENLMQVFDNRDDNFWDNDYPSGGNYWSDYSGNDNLSGPNQDLPGSDGIGDEPYVIDLDSQDRYPLMSPSGLIHPRPPKMLQASLSGKNFENVTLAWSLSPDDGNGSKSVIGYNIYRNMTYDQEGLDYSLIASLPNSTSTFTDYGAGEGNLNDYFYRVCARNVINTTVCSRTQAGKFTRPFVKEPNLASVPLIQSDESVETVLQTVDFDKAWVYDSSSEKWKWFMTFKPYKGELRSINETRGFWVNVTEDCNFTIAGIVPLETTIRLDEGWNLVSFPSFIKGYTVADLGREVNVTVRVEGFSPSSQPYRLVVMQETDALEAGYGYWIEVAVSTRWFTSN